MHEDMHSPPLLILLFTHLNQQNRQSVIVTIPFLQCTYFIRRFMVLIYYTCTIVLLYYIIVDLFMVELHSYRVQSHISGCNMPMDRRTNVHSHTTALVAGLKNAWEKITGLHTKSVDHGNVLDNINEWCQKAQPDKIEEHIEKLVSIRGSLYSSPSRSEPNCSYQNLTSSSCINTVSDKHNYIDPFCMYFQGIIR